jgi:hypothetical protein
MQLTTWGILVIFIIGLLFTATHSSQTVQEAFEGRVNASQRCPDILIQKGSELYLHNSRIAKVPGVNPLKFNDLEEYAEFMEWQRSQGIRCPVLYLQHTFDAQGKPVYKIAPARWSRKAGCHPRLRLRLRPLTALKTPTIRHWMPMRTPHLTRWNPKRGP